MRQNDLIIFDFQSTDRGEVLLDPGSIGMLSDQLAQIFIQISNLANFEPDSQIEMKLAAVERGSLKIGFKPLWKNKKIAEPLSVAANLVTVMGPICTIFIFVGIRAGYFQPVQGNIVREPSVHIEADVLSLADHNVRDGIESLTRVALNAGAESVTILVPRLRSAKTGQPYQGNVLIDWQSRRQPPDAGLPTVTVRGALSPFDPADFQALGPITHGHRSISGVLVVEGVQGFD